MKYILKIIILLPVLINSCTLMQPRVKNDNFFLPGERTIMDKTTAAIDYGFCYDTDVELNCIFSFSSNEISPQKEKELFNLLKEFKIAELKNFYEKLYRLKSMNLCKMNIYKKEKEWINYTYLKNYLIPPLEIYESLLQKYVILNSPEYESILGKIKQRIDKEIIFYYNELEKEKEREEYRL